MSYNLTTMGLSDEKKYKLLLEISHKVRDTLDLNETLDHLLETVKTVVHYDAAGIFVLNQDLAYRRHESPRQLIAGIARRGYDPRFIDEDDMLRYGKGIVGHVIFTCTALIVPDVQQDARYVVARSRTQSEIAVPIIRNNRAIGALNLESDQLDAFDENDLDELRFFADAAAISIEKALLHQQLLEKKLIDKQLQLARDMQLRLFPAESPDIAGYDIAGICLPADEIGGDYYDFIKLPSLRLGIAVADVSGHGIASALVMTAFRGLLRMHTRGRRGPARIARAVNRLLPEFTADSDFVTVVYIVLKPELDEFTYICCGQQPPLLLHADGSQENLDVHGPALGVYKKVSYSTDNLSISPGDILAIYTDGVVELTDAAGIEFGAARLVSAIQEARDLPAENLIQHIIQVTRQFSGSHNFQDDFTLVIIKRH
jgi:phosphoserine phosphatase RsbU/P